MEPKPAADGICFVLPAAAHSQQARGSRSHPATSQLIDVVWIPGAPPFFPARGVRLRTGLRYTPAKSSCFWGGSTSPGHRSSQSQRKGFDGLSSAVLQGLKATRLASCHGAERAASQLISSRPRADTAQRRSVGSLSQSRRDGRRGRLIGALELTSSPAWNPRTPRTWLPSLKKRRRKKMQLRSTHLVAFPGTFLFMKTSLPACSFLATSLELYGPIRPQYRGARAMQA